jgi:hypothetical protein
MGLTLSANGVFYGAALTGGAAQSGAIFKQQPPATPGGYWTETVLYSFLGGGDGCSPFAPPLVASDGSLYGPTLGSIYIGPYPGPSGSSTVWHLTPPSGTGQPGGNWSKTTLAAFGPGDSFDVGSPLILRNGTMYGATGTLRGGEVFELQPSGSADIAAGDQFTKVVLHKFTDGNTPSGRLVMDQSGAIYGTTINFSPAGPPPSGIAYRIQP